MLLQLVVELNHVHDVPEVLHELLVVDAAVAIHIRQQIQRQCLLLTQLQVFLGLLQANLVFVPLEEAISVDIDVAENSVRNSLLKLRHLHVTSSELAHCHELCFAAESGSLELGLNLLLANFGERLKFDLGIPIWLGETEQHRDLERC